MESVIALLSQCAQKGFRPGSVKAEQLEPVEGVWSTSIHNVHGATFFMVDLGGKERLVCWGSREAAMGFNISAVGAEDLVLIDPVGQDTAILHRHFPFTKPVPVLKHRATIGMGDRLGLATPGHAAAVAQYDAMPIFAQQSLRELTLTNRTYPDVIAAASWGALRAGWTAGYGADGDHLKTHEAVAAALRDGATMITLDCSDFIDANAGDVPAAQRSDRLAELDWNWAGLEKRYVDQEHTITGADGQSHTIRFTAEQLAQIALTYGRAINFTRDIFQTHIVGAACDFELSIDETDTPTDPAAHLFIATELRDLGVELATLAPRFCGEFQKGIDYIGDVEQFERELAVHAALADHFGYKLSIHSGSDKFAVFPLIGRYTKGRVHVKTAGTSWLEAMRLIAMQEPTLFREVHAFACESFAQAAAFYHVRAHPDQLAPIQALPDEALPQLLDDPGHRQVLHITYGLILTAECDSAPRFKSRLYDTWRRYATEHEALLASHLGRHLETLGIPRR